MYFYKLNISNTTEIAEIPTITEMGFLYGNAICVKNELDNLKENKLTKDEFISLVKDTEVFKNNQLNLEELRKYKLQVLNDVFEDLYNHYTSEVPNSEQNTWERQDKEARLYKETKNELDCPFLKSLAEIRNIPLDILVDKVIEKSNIYQIFLAQLVGKRQLLEDLITKADLYEELFFIDINFN